VGDLAATVGVVRGVGFPAPVPEHRFAPPRRWRFDLCWPAHMVALEREGGTWKGGRHTRGKGYAADCEKYSRAAVLGWRVVRVTADMVRSGLAAELLLAALEAAKSEGKGL
jgi:hypothetical protein